MISKTDSECLVREDGMGAGGREARCSPSVSVCFEWRDDKQLVALPVLRMDPNSTCLNEYRSYWLEYYRFAMLCI